MVAHPVVAAVSDRRRRSEIDATIYVPPYSNETVRKAYERPSAHGTSDDRMCQGFFPKFTWIFLPMTWNPKTKYPISNLPTL